MIASLTASVFAADVLIAQNVFFYIIATVMVFSALKVVTTKNIVHAALYLVLVLAGVAAQFIMLGAEFLGVTQVLVYIGAVIVLFLFGVMLTRAKIGDEERANHDNRAPALLTAVMLLAVMCYAVIDWAGSDLLPYGQPTTTEDVAESIFTDFIVPFEAVSVLLLAALIGAIVLARKE